MFCQNDKSICTLRELKTPLHKKSTCRGCLVGNVQWNQMHHSGVCDHWQHLLLYTQRTPSEPYYCAGVDVELCLLLCVIRRTISGRVLLVVGLLSLLLLIEQNA